MDESGVRTSNSKDDFQTGLSWKQVLLLFSITY